MKHSCCQIANELRALDKYEKVETSGMPVNVEQLSQWAGSGERALIGVC